MRITILALTTAACSNMDYRLIEHCTFGTEFTICRVPVSYYKAEEMCDRMGDRLVFADSRPRLNHITAATASLGEPHWAGWGPYECPLMENGAVAPWDCEDLRPFVCEVVVTAPER